jgi:SAM-dependent methyltransferase
MSDTNSHIHESVREHYARQARLGSSCCGSSSSLYPAELIGQVPGEVADFSLGCGNPLALAGIRPGETVLDLGSGGGLDCFLAARKVGEEGQVIGVDMTGEMVERARLSAERQGMANVEFRQGYLEALPVADASVDLVISNCVINLSPDKPQVFREAFRVLKPGGRISVSDTVAAGPIPETLRKDMQAWGGCVAGALSADEYRSGLRSAGFVDVSIEASDGAAPDPCCGQEGRVYSALIKARRPD